MIYLIILAFSFMPAICLASDLPSVNFLSDHAELFQWFLGLAIIGNGFFLMRTLNNIDKQWKKLWDIDRRLSHLEGEHKTQHGRRAED